MNVKATNISIIYVIRKAEENINKMRRKIEDRVKTQNKLLEIKKQHDLE